MTNEPGLRADERARAHLACAIEELHKRGYDARGKSIADVRQAVVAAEAEIRRAIFEKRSYPLAKDHAPANPNR